MIKLICQNIQTQKYLQTKIIIIFHQSAAFHQLLILFRCREDEVRAEMAEREVNKLQKEVDKLEVRRIIH